MNGHNGEKTMTDHKTGTREQWLAARLAVAKAKKELTRRSDELALRPAELPWVRIDRRIEFETDEGQPRWQSSSRALAAPRLPLMFGSDYTRGVRPVDDRGRVRRLRRPTGQPRVTL